MSYALAVLSARFGFPEEYWLEDDRRLATILELVEQGMHRGRD